VPNHKQALAGARLEEAAGLLSSAGPPQLAPGLQANVRRALADLRPACVLDQLQVRAAGAVPRKQQCA